MPTVNLDPLFQGNPSECVESFTYNVDGTVATATLTDREGHDSCYRSRRRGYLVAGLTTYTLRALTSAAVLRQRNYGFQRGCSKSTIHNLRRCHKRHRSTVRICTDGFRYYIQRTFYIYCFLVCVAFFAALL